MSRGSSAVAATLLLLVGCDNEPTPVEPVEVKNISQLEMRTLLAEHSLLKPGLYKVTAKIEAVVVPARDDDDMQAQTVLQMIRDRMQSVPGVTSENCLAPNAAFDPRGAEAPDCQVSAFKLVGNDTDFILVCPTPSGEQIASSNFTGTVGQDSYALTAITKVPVTPGPSAKARDATLNTKVTGERIGDCG